MADGERLPAKVGLRGILAPMSDLLTAPFELTAVRVPRAALADASGFAFDEDAFALADLAVDENGTVARLVPSASSAPVRWIAFPPLVEPHTHIDKAFLRARARNPQQDFEGARAAIERDRAGGWTHADAFARMQRALELAHGHGVVALRTHLDSQPDRLQPCWEIFRELRESWRGRIELQAVVSLGSAKLQGAHGECLGHLAAAHGALLGPVFYADAQLADNVARTFELAGRFGLDIDAHIDENNHGHADGLRAVLDHLDRHAFAGSVTLSHMCSLARCEPQEIDLLARRAAAHGIAVIALPIANLHLQDRDRGGTPCWRGVAPVNALARADVDVAIGGDNSQDMFVPWGALDPLAALRETLLAAQLAEPLGDAVARAASLAARVIGVDAGLLRTGAAADCTLFEAADPFGALDGDYRQRLTLRAGRVVARRSFELPR